MSAISLKGKLAEIFIDPISLVELVDPVTNSVCGHTFSRQHIEGWMRTPAQRAAPTCPLDRQPIGQLSRNLIIQQALEALNDPSNSLLGRVEDLSGKDKEEVELAAKCIKDKREEDARNSIPYKLAEPHFFEKMKIFSEKHCFSRKTPTEEEKS